MRYHQIGLTLALLTSCTAVPPMSAAAHDEAAKNELQAAQAERTGYDPSKDRAVVHCGPYLGAGDDLAAETPPPCWTEIVNPTSHLLEDARHLERIARAHQAASTHLREVEERECAGVEERDRHTSPFSHADAIATFTIDADPAGKRIGATVTFAAVKGLTVDWLKRVVACHLAIDAETGNDVSAGDPCPLVPRGVRAKVVADPSGPQVILRADSPAAVEEVIHRVAALKTVGSSPVSAR